MHSDIIKKTIEYWGLTPIEVNFITQRENHIYQIITQDESYCLRVHRKGLRSRDEVYSEILWINTMREGGVNVPMVIPSLSGNVMHEIDGIIVDVLTWMPGQPMGIDEVLGDFDDYAKVYFHLGEALAELHNVSDNWDIPVGFTRPVWDREGIIGEEPIWGKFWENHCLYFTDKSALLSVKHYANEVLEDCDDELDYGLIHADVIPDNVLINNDKATLVNFGDGGFGYRLFDIATILNRAMREKNYELNKEAFLKGYRTQRPLDEKHLLLFQALRSFTYLGWIIPRLNEPKGSERCKMFIDESCELAARFLTTS